MFSFNETSMRNFIAQSILPFCKSQGFDFAGLKPSKSIIILWRREKNYTLNSVQLFTRCFRLGNFVFLFKRPYMRRKKNATTPRLKNLESIKWKWPMENCSRNASQETKIFLTGDWLIFETCVHLKFKTDNRSPAIQIRWALCSLSKKNVWHIKILSSSRLMYSINLVYPLVFGWMLSSLTLLTHYHN